MAEPPEPAPINWGNLPDALVAHSYIKHNEIQNDYNKPPLGGDSWNIQSRADLRAKSLEILNDPGTRVYVSTTAEGKENILIVSRKYGAVIQLSPDHPEQASIYRPSKPLSSFEDPHADGAKGSGPLTAHEFEERMKAKGHMDKITEIDPAAIANEEQKQILESRSIRAAALERDAVKELARDERLKPYLQKGANGEEKLSQPLPAEAREIINERIRKLIADHPDVYKDDPRIRPGKAGKDPSFVKFENEFVSKIDAEQLKIYKSAQRDAAAAHAQAEREAAARQQQQNNTGDHEHGAPGKPDPAGHTTGEGAPGHTGEASGVHKGPGGIGSKTIPVEPENIPHNGANAVMGLGIALQAAGTLTGPDRLTTGQKVTLVGQASTGLAQMGLEYATPSFVNVKGGPTNWTGVGNNMSGDVTALGRLGGGLGTLGGGLGMYSSAAGFVDAAQNHNTVGMVLNGGNFAASTAFTVGGVAQIMGDASLAADSTGVGLIIGVPLQVAGLGFQIYDWRTSANYMKQLMDSRLSDERQESQGGASHAYNYIPGLPLKPTFNEYDGLMRLNIELKSQHITYPDGKPVDLKDFAGHPEAIAQLAQFAANQYDKGVKDRQDALDGMSSWQHSSTLGQFADYLRKNLRNIDDQATFNHNLEVGEHEVALGTAGRATLGELSAGGPNGNNMVGYGWRVDEYNRRLKPLEGKYDAQIAQLNKLGDLYHGARLRAANPQDQDRFVREQAHQSIVDERKRVEAMTPAQQDAYFRKNREFVEKAGLKDRTDLGLVALSTSREDYNRKTLAFAPSVYDAKAVQALSHNATILKTLNDQHGIYSGREKQLERLMPGVHPGDMPVTDEKGKPVVKDGKTVTFADVQKDIAHNIQDAQAQIAALKKDPKSATDPDMKARVDLATVQLQALQIRYADNENQNLSYKLQMYDKSVAALAAGNGKIRQEITAAGLNNVPVTPTAAMLRANQTYVDGIKAIQQESQALTASKKSFDQKFGSPEAQAALLKKGDPAYIAALSRLQGMEFQISVDRIKAMQAEHDYLRGFESEAHKAVSPKTSSANNNEDADDVVADGGVRNRDGTTAASGALTTTFTASAEGQAPDPSETSGPGQAAPAPVRPKAPAAVA